MITFKHSGDFSKTDTFLQKLKRNDIYSSLDKYGQLGVEALRDNTPKDSGETANAWNYEIKKERGSVEIVWTNTNMNEGVPIAVLIQYGHGLHQGGYVQGIDYINPAMQPIFEQILDSVWREVTD